VIREELARLFTWQERHRRLAARLIIAFVLTLVVLAAGSVLIWIFESGKQGGQIHGFGDAVFFTAVQLLTISSSITQWRLACLGLDRCLAICAVRVAG
jgi:small neutral amino acid transporter SnatA (MarC family)